MFSQRKNKRFSYKPRFQDSENLKANPDMESKWGEIKGISKRRGSKLFSLPALLIMLIFLFVLMYILEGYIN